MQENQPETAWCFSKNAYLTIFPCLRPLAAYNDGIPLAHVYTHNSYIPQICTKLHFSYHQHHCGLVYFVVIFEFSYFWLFSSGNQKKNPPKKLR